MFSPDFPENSSPFFSVLLGYWQRWLPSSCLWIWKSQQHFILLYSFMCFLAFLIHSVSFTFFFFSFLFFLALSADFLPYWDSYRALAQGMGSFYCLSDFLVRTKWVGKYIYISDAKSGSLRWILLRELLFPISCFFFQIDVRRLNMMRAGEVRWSQSRSVHYFYLRLLCIVFLLIFYQGDKKGK